MGWFLCRKKKEQTMDINILDCNCENCTRVSRYKGFYQSMHYSDAFLEERLREDKEYFPCLSSGISPKERDSKPDMVFEKIVCSLHNGSKSLTECWNCYMQKKGWKQVRKVAK